MNDDIVKLAIITNTIIQLIWFIHTLKVHKEDKHE